MALPQWKRFALVARGPVITVIFIRLLEFLSWWLVRQQRLRLDRRRLQTSCVSQLDSELLQGCLMSTEHLVSLGRIEKRTIFSRPLLEVLGGNLHLQRELLWAGEECRSRGRSCLVARWMPPDERYHVLQAGLNAASALFGADYLRFNALGGQNPAAFKPTWYCLTVSTPMRAKSPPRSPRARAASKDCPESVTATFQDMTRRPRAALRIMLVNETELRQIADGKLGPPEWGFFNVRHAERFRMLQDFAVNFRSQLVRSSCNGGVLDHRSPFTSQAVHNIHRADVGQFKRINSVPVHMSTGNLRKHDAEVGGLSGLRKRSSEGRARRQHRASDKGSMSPHAIGDGGGDENCFLRMNVPLPTVGNSHVFGSRATNDDSSDELTAAVHGSIW